MNNSFQGREFYQRRGRGNGNNFSKGGQNDSWSRHLNKDEREKTQKLRKFLERVNSSKDADGMERALWIARYKGTDEPFNSLIIVDSSTHYVREKAQGNLDEINLRWDLRTALDNLEREKNLRTALEEAQKRLQNLVKKHEEDSDRKEEDINNLKKEVENSLKNLEDDKTQVKYLERELMTERSENDRIREDYQQLQQVHNHFTEARVRINDLERELENEKEQRRNDILAIQQLEGTQRRVAQLEETLREIRVEQAAAGQHPQQDMARLEQPPVAQDEHLTTIGNKQKQYAVKIHGNRYTLAKIYAALPKNLRPKAEDVFSPAEITDIRKKFQAIPYFVGDGTRDKKDKKPRPENEQDDHLARFSSGTPYEKALKHSQEEPPYPEWKDLQGAVEIYPNICRLCSRRFHEIFICPQHYSAATRMEYADAILVCPVCLEQYVLCWLKGCTQQRCRICPQSAEDHPIHHCDDSDLKMLVIKYLAAVELSTRRIMASKNWDEFNMRSLSRNPAAENPELFVHYVENMLHGDACAMRRQDRRTRLHIREDDFDGVEETVLERAPGGAAQ